MSERAVARQAVSGTTEAFREEESLSRHDLAVGQQWPAVVPTMASDGGHSQVLFDEVSKLAKYVLFIAFGRCSNVSMN